MNQDFNLGMNRSFLICLMLIIVMSSSYGQTNFQAGYIVTLEGDSIFGEIDKRGDLRNGRICTYRADPKAESVEFLPGEIAAYRFLDGKFYISKALPINNVQTQVFAEYLVNGIADLYYFRDEKSDHYLIEEEDGSIMELTNKTEEVYVDGAKYLKKSNRHIGLLKATFSDCMEVQGDIEKASLSHKSLIQITSDYHYYVCDGEKCIVYEKEIPALKVVFAPLAGIGSSSIILQNDPTLQKIDFESNVAPFIGLQLITKAPRINDKISLSLATNLTNDYFYGYYEEQEPSSITYLDAHVNTLFLKSTFAFRYTFPRGKFRPTVTAGGLMNILVWGNSGYSTETIIDQQVITDAYPELMINKMLWGGFVHLGMDYHLLKNRVFFSNLGVDYGSGVKTGLMTKLTTFSFSIGTYF